MWFGLPGLNPDLKPTRKTLEQLRLISVFILEDNSWTIFIVCIRTAGPLPAASLRRLMAARTVGGVWRFTAEVWRLILKVFTTVELLTSLSSVESSASDNHQQWNNDGADIRQEGVCYDCDSVCGIASCYWSVSCSSVESSSSGSICKQQPYRASLHPNKKIS